MKEYTLEDMVEFMKKEFQLETQIRDSAGSYDYSLLKELLDKTKANRAED